jgi:DnaJ like chaperone protein
MWDFFKTKFGRIFGALMGLSGAGFFGALIGFSIGALIDKLHKDGFLIWDNDTDSSERGDFILSSMIMAASVLQANSKKENFELEYIRQYLEEQYGIGKAEEYLKLLHRALNQNWDVRKVTQYVRTNNTYETKLQLLYFLFGIADADKKLEEKEIANIKIISIHLGILPEDYNAIKKMFINDLDTSYNILGINSSATDIEIKEAYRNMANRFHPDKNPNLNDEMAELAKEKFQRLRQAYQKVKADRGIK